MKRIRNQSIDITPLLDVVFILLFALMINVSVAKAEDTEKLEGQTKALEVIEERNTLLLEALQQEKSDTNKINQSLEKMKEALLLSEAMVTSQKFQIENQKIEIDAFIQALSELLEEEAINMEDELDSKMLAKLKKEGVLLDQWLKYQQIAKRYLFVDVRLSNKEGRVYVGEIYTQVAIEREDLTNKVSRDEKIKALSEFLFNWLDHKEGGYSFVFVTVEGEEGVTRGSIKIIFDALNILQPTFDQDYYLINKYVRYVD